MRDAVYRVGKNRSRSGRRNTTMVLGGSAVLDSLIQQFAGGSANSLEGEALHGGVTQLLGSAPNEHKVGAIGEALGALGPAGFGQSVSQGAGSAGPEARGGLAGMLMSAISQGGGSPGNVLSSLGVSAGGNSMGPSELGTLATYRR